MSLRRRLGTLALAVSLVAGFSLSHDAASAVTDTEQQLQTSLQNYFASQSPHYTLSLREIGGGNAQVGLDDTMRIEPASVIKLFWAWATLREVDAGRLSLASQIQPGFTWATCLDLMIKVSDNTCAGWIREGLGNANLNQLLSAEGYLNTQIVLDGNGLYKTKFTTAADTSLLLLRIETGIALSPASTTYFHNLLKEQVFRSRITAGVQRGFTVENKGGELWIPGGWTESDAAIIRGPISTYVLVIYGRNDAKNSQIAAVSKIVFEKLQNLAVSRPTILPKRQYITTSAVWVRKKANGRFAYRAKKGALAQLILADKDWVEIKQDGHRAGFVRFTSLKLRSAYIWP